MAMEAQHRLFTAVRSDAAVLGGGRWLSHLSRTGLKIRCWEWADLACSRRCVSEGEPMVSKADREHKPNHTSYAL